MDAIAKEVAKLCDVEKFIRETNATSTYGECHQALVWLAIQIKRSALPEHIIWLCTGMFAGQDHSWMQVEDAETGDQTIVDMTVDQFGAYENMPYVGPVSPGYVICQCVLLSDAEALPEFVEALG
jgi:hypothetical protein